MMVSERMVDGSLSNLLNKEKFQKPLSNIERINGWKLSKMNCHLWKTICLEVNDVFSECEAITFEMDFNYKNRAVTRFKARLDLNRVISKSTE